MGDDITIGVTEIVNNIEVTAQPNDQVIDISVIDNADEVTLNVTPTVVEVNVNRGSSYARWGTIYGTLGDQTDLANALLLKADLVGGLVPAYQLPSFVDDVIEVANYAALPSVGETGKIYLTLDNNKIYRWSGSVYVEIASNQAIWGSITGTLSAQTDLQNALNAKVPTARNLTINGTTYDLSADRSWTISGATWGSITGTLSSQTDLQSALDAKVTTARTLTINGTAYDLSTDRSWTINSLPSMIEYSETDKTVWNNGKANIGTNTSFGESSLIGASAGTNNTSYGYRSLYSTSFQASSVTAIGSSALRDNTTGNNNTAVGSNSLVSNLTGSNNIAIGQQSGQTYQNISTSIFIGNQTAASGENQTNQIVIGHGAIGNGTNSVTLGSTSITRTFLQGDVLVGVTASVRRLTVNDSAGFYSGAFSGGTSGNYVGLGVKSTVPVIQGFLNTNNVADLSLQPDGGNVGVGLLSPSFKFQVRAGTDQNFCVASGGTNDLRFLSLNDANSVTQSLSIQGSPLLFRVAGGVEAMRITSGGNVGIGTTNPTRALDVTGVVRSFSATGAAAFVLDSLVDSCQFYFAKNNVLKWANGTNTGAGGPNDFAFYTYGASFTSLILYANGNYQFFGSNVSDRRAKEKIEDLDFNATEKIMALQPKSYYMKNDNKKLKYGLIAQDVYEVLPDLVSGDLEAEGFAGLDYNGIIPILVQSIQEQNEVLAQLKSEIELLKAK